MSVSFYFEDIRFRLLHRKALRAWLLTVIIHERKSSGMLNYIFVTDAYLLKLNKKYLQHNTLTDVITFDYSQPTEGISGDIYISYERVRENAIAFGVKRQDELHRVMVHGLLHLLGYGDKTPAQREKMRQREDFYLSLRTF